MKQKVFTNLNQAVGPKNGSFAFVYRVIIHTEAASSEITQVEDPVLLELYFCLQFHALHEPLPAIVEGPIISL